MKVAFDVKGTLVGPQSLKVRRLFDALRDLNCNMTVWSNMYSYAHDFVSENGLTAEARPKFCTWDVDDEADYMDLAIEDDHSQDYLAAKRIIFVDQIPEDVESFAKELVLEKRTA